MFVAGESHSAVMGGDCDCSSGELKLKEAASEESGGAACDASTGALEVKEVGTARSAESADDCDDCDDWMTKSNTNGSGEIQSSCGVELRALLATVSGACMDSRDSHVSLKSVHASAPSSQPNKNDG